MFDYKKGILFTLTLCCSTFYSCGLVSNVRQESSETTERYTITQQSASEFVTASGEIRPYDEIEIIAPYVDTIGSVYVSVGDSVQEGDLLFSYNTNLLSESKATLEEELAAVTDEQEKTHLYNTAKLSDAEEQRTIALKDAQLTIDRAEQDRDRAYQKYQDVVNQRDALRYELDITPEEESEQIQLAYDQAVAEVESLNETIVMSDRAVEDAYAQYNAVMNENDKLIQEYQDALLLESSDLRIEKIQKQINVIQKKIDNANVQSSWAGIVTQVNVNAGANAQDRPAITIAKQYSYSAVVHVNEEDIERIENGMSAFISMSGRSEQYEGTVSKICRMPDGNQDTYSVEIMLDCKNELYIGRNVSAKIIVTENQSAMMVPYLFLGQNSDGKTYVLKCNSDNTTETVYVEIGIKTVDQAEVISDTISEGCTLLKIE